MIKLIIEQIRQVFPGTKVYDETVQQGLKPPAFQVLIIDDEQRRKLGNNAEWEYFININYFPENNRGAESENNRVAERFKINFRYIGDEFHVNSLEASKSDGVLVISFSVIKHVKEVHDGIKMQSLDYGGVSSD